MKECIQQGCHELIKSGSRCEKHNYHKQYKRNRTDVKEQAFYNSTPWKHFKDIVMRKHHYLCVRCKRQAVYCDHIIPLKVDWDKRLDSSNLQPLCSSCHKTKTYEDEREYNIKSNVGDNVRRPNQESKTKQSLNDFYSSDEWS